MWPTTRETSAGGVAGKGRATRGLRRTSARALLPAGVDGPMALWPTDALVEDGSAKSIRARWRAVQYGEAYLIIKKNNAAKPEEKRQEKPQVIGT